MCIETPMGYKYFNTIEINTLKSDKLRNDDLKGKE